MSEQTHNWSDIVSGYILDVIFVTVTDIGCSDHFLVWVELGRATKNSKKGKKACN